MKRFAALHWLTALALLLGQWGMLVHAGEHPLDGMDDALCVVCVQGHNLQHLQVGHSPVFIFSSAALAPAQSVAVEPLSIRPERSTIRAPPYSVHN